VAAIVATSTAEPKAFFIAVPPLGSGSVNVVMLRTSVLLKAPHIEKVLLPWDYRIVKKR
jgi:hypothetical protein